MQPDNEAWERTTIEFDTEVTHRGKLIEIARRFVKECYIEEDWIDNYPESWQDALAMLLSERGISALPVDGPVKLISHSTHTNEFNAKWPKEIPEQ